jgi:hypothetical protein
MPSSTLLQVNRGASAWGVTTMAGNVVIYVVLAVTASFTGDECWSVICTNGNTKDATRVKSRHKRLNLWNVSFLRKTKKRLYSIDSVKADLIIYSIEH